MLRSRRLGRNRIRNRRPIRGLEALEAKRLMTGDMCTLDTPELIRERLDQVVIELGEAALEVNPELEAILQANENEPVEQFLLRTDGVEILPPQVWPQVIDESPLPELGQLLVDPQQQEALNDLVLLELVELQNEQFIIEELSEQFVFDLSGVLGEENGPPELPPEFEQLRLELGDEGFAEWLESNRQQTGTASGVSAEDIEQLGPQEIDQFEQVEDILNDWTRHFEEGGAGPVVTLEEIDGLLEGVVEELAVLVLETVPENQLQQILIFENEQPEQFLFRTNVDDLVPPDLWRQAIDNSQLPELGQVLIDPPQQEALADLVVLELVEFNNEQFLYDSISEPLIIDLSGVLNGPSQPPELPPQFEQLLQELGEEQFVEWLLTNQQETGTFSGVTEDTIGELDPEGLAELDRVEGLLDQWLRNFDRETGGNEPCPDIVLPDPNVDDQPIELPPEMEQLRQELGDEAFAEFLQSNLEQIGNLTGVSQNELDQFDEEQLAEFDCTDELLQAWLEDFQENVEPEPVLPGDADANGEVDFSDFLIMSRHFGTEVEGGFLEGDFDLNGVVEFPDFLVLSRHFGQTLEQQE